MCAHASVIQMPITEREPLQEGVAGLDTKIYRSAGITFSREHLMSCLDTPSGSFDIRMLPCLDELARDLGRPEPSKQSSKSSKTNTSARSQQTWCKWHGQWWFWAGGWNKWVPR